MTADPVPRREPFRLLPQDLDLGWTPYAWLIYLAVFVAYLPRVGYEPLEWVLVGLLVTVFLALYFVGYWLRDRRLLWVIAGITAIGLLLAPRNPGASVFFVYAAAFAGFTGSRRLAIGAIIAVVLCLGAEAWLLGLPPAFWIPGLVFSLLIGGVNSHYGEVARTRAQLQRAEEEVERLAKLAERERIARDLHDLLGHTLSLITLKAELAGRLLERDPVRAAVEIGEVERISRTALAEVRQAVTGFRASGLDAELVNAKLVTAAAGITLKCRVDQEAVEGLDDRALGMVLREAITNVIRHSGATSCELTIARHARGIRLTLEDDGCGLGGAPEGSGIAGMRARIAALGGELRLEDGAGTRLVVELSEPPAHPPDPTRLVVAAAEGRP